MLATSCFWKGASCPYRWHNLIFFLLNIDRGLHWDKGSLHVIYDFAHVAAQWPWACHILTFVISIHYGSILVVNSALDSATLIHQLVTRQATVGHKLMPILCLLVCQFRYGPCRTHLLFAYMFWQSIHHNVSFLCSPILLQLGLRFAPICHILTAYIFHVKVVPSWAEIVGVGWYTKRHPQLFLNFIDCGLIRVEHFTFLWSSIISRWRCSISAVAVTLLSRVVVWLLELLCTLLLLLLLI